MLADLVAQIGEVVVGVGPGLFERGRRAVSGHDMLGLERGETVEGFQPLAGDRLLQHAEDALGEDDVAGEHRLARRQPDVRVAGRVCRARVDDLELHAAELEGVCVVEHGVGIDRLGAVERVADQRLQHGELHRLAFLLVGDGVGGGDDGRALVGPVAIAEPAVILAAGVDDDFHRLVGDLADRRVDFLCAPAAAAGIDQHDAFVRDDDAEGGVVGEVFRRALLLAADQRVDAVGDRLGFEIAGHGGGGAGQNGRGGDSASKYAHGAPPVFARICPQAGAGDIDASQTGVRGLLTPFCANPGNSGPY
jgi:hypothetical protein